MMTTIVIAVEDSNDNDNNGRKRSSTSHIGGTKLIRRKNIQRC